MREQVKEYLRVSDDNDTQIEGLISAAKAYLKNAGAVEDEQNELYVLAVKILVTHWYENRLPVGKVTEEITYTLRHILVQLKYCHGGDSA